MPKIVTVEQMRTIEAATDAAGVSYAAMMDRAGRAVADLVKARLGDAHAGAKVLVLVGPGNNGGDGLVAGRLVAEETEAEVAFYLFKARTPEKDINFAKVKEAGLSVTTAAEDQGGAVLRKRLLEADILVDALLGTGTRLPIKGAMAGLLIETGRVVGARRKAAPVLSYRTPGAPSTGDSEGPLVVAVDCPSGLNCDTGEIDPAALQADDTVTFAAVKVGQVRFPGAGKLGRLHVADIGTPPDLPEVQDITLELVDGAAVRALFPERPIDGHKGTFGKALVVAGSLNYIGAPALAARAAYRVGAGWVTVATPQPLVDMLAPQIAEATWIHLPHDLGVLAPAAVPVLRKELEPYSAMLLGPGWGQEKPTAEFLEGILRPEDRPAKRRAIGFVRSDAGEGAETPETSHLPSLVVDADGLNLLSGIEDWHKLLPAETILTPHPGEMARLCGATREEVQADRIAAAREHAAKWGCVVILKGAYTVVAAPDGRASVIPFATSALATAGTGDVLAGVILGLRAQGLAAFDAAVAGAYLHGLAGELAAEWVGAPASVVAGDVGDMLPHALAWINEAVG
ncbi:MAG: bifunctional ADP-dependent NAD(P)H-hydrate dehydratase/NAD(P)H-hydrate epimerase [Anaerolineae bacterium]|nr:bifunctional ADP-dependent NAD(P)H-hydrate dehydratase/NAD(P)H-hydrate epimerase [Anaerolineae bacterium]